MTDIVDPFAEGYKAPTSGIVDPFDPNYSPPKPRGMGAAFGAGVKETVGQASQAAGAITGATGIEQWGKDVRAGAAPTEDESTGVAVARAAGGLVGWLPAIAGTLAAIPAAPEEAVGAGLLMAGRGMAGMLLPAAANKVTTTQDLKDKGVDDATAQKAGWASAATTAATGAVPLSMAGGLLKRAATGAVSGLVVGEASREAQNAVLVEHPELQTMVAGKDMVVNSVVGAMLAGIMGPRPIKTEIANFKEQAEKDVASGAPTEKPAAPEFRLQPSGEIKVPEAPAPEFKLEPQNTAQHELPLGEHVPAAPEVNPAQPDLFAPKPIPTRTELAATAKTVLGEDHSISKQTMAQAVKGADSVEVVAENLRAKAVKTRDPATKSDLQQLADHLSPVKETPNATTVESPASLDVREQAGNGKTMGGGNTKPEIAAAKEGNGPVTEGEKVDEKAAQAQSREAKQQEIPAERHWGVESLSKIVADAKAGKPDAEVKEPKVDAKAESREAQLEKIKTARELTPTEHRELVALKTDNAEARAWAEAKDRADSMAHAGEAFQAHERADKLGDKDAADTQAALKDAKTVGEALTKIRESVSPKWQKFIDGLMSVPEAMAGKFELSGISKTNLVTNAARLGEHAKGDITLHNGAGVSTLLHEAVHAKTAWGVDNDPAFRKEVQAIFDAAKESGKFTGSEYMFKDLHEFVAEASTKPELQALLDKIASPQGKTLFNRLIEAIRKLLGLQPGQKSLLHDVLSMVEMAPSPKYGPRAPSVLDTQYSERAVRLGFSTPVSAAKTVDAVTTKALSMWDSLKPAIQRTHLNWSQMTHIADMTEDLVPRLPQWGPNAINPVRDKVNSMLASGAIAKELNHAAQGIYDKMQALAPKQKEALVSLMGKYQLAKVFPNLPIEAHTWLSPAEKVLYREAKQLYAQPGVAEAYDAARLHNQRLHDTGMAAMLKSMAQIYGVPEPIWRAINVREGMSKEVTALLDHVKASNDHDLQDHFTTAMGLHEAKKTESYFSLGRDGDYMVNFHIKDTPEAHAAVQKALSAAGVKDSIVVNPGDTHVFSMFETMNQMLAVTKQLDTIKSHLEHTAGTDHEGKPTASPYTAGLAVEKLKALDSSAPSFIRGMLAKIDADPHLDGEQKSEQQELLRRMYINMLPESSVSKFYARRAGTPGYSSDMARSFVKRAAAGAYFTAQHATRPEQNVAMARLREATSQLGDAGSPYFDLKKQAAATNVINELNQRTANMLQPLHTPMLDTMSAIGHAFYLSASPGFILQNLAQPYQLTLPYLGGRHGFRASSVAMGSAAKDVAKIIKDTIQQGWQGNKWTGVLDATITVDRAEHLGADDKAALKHLIASGRADWTQGGELTKIAEGSNRSMETALKSANSMSYYGEVMNRMQTGLAAYRLELKRTGDKEKALDYMVRSVDDTQINYATENKARAIGKHGVFGQMTPMVMAFQQFNLGVLQLLGKLTMQATKSGAPAAERLEAAKSLGGILAATSVAAGTMGLPFAGVVMGAYNSLMGDENHPVDAKTDYQNYLSDIMGHDAAQVVSHGAMNYLSGADVASKLGQENVIPFTGLFSQLMDSRQPLKDRINSGALSFMGPVVNGGASVLQGLSKVADGDTMKGLEQMSPAMLKGSIKAVDLANNGFTDSKGIPLPMEATSWDTTVQALGFTPTKQATQREAQQGVNAIQGALKQQQHALANRFVAAVEAHDVEARQQVMEEAKTFMRANPGMKVDFAGAMRRRAQETAVAKATGGVKSRVSQIPMVEQQTRFMQP